MYQLFDERQFRKNLSGRQNEVLLELKKWTVSQLDFRLSLIKRNFDNAVEFSPSYFLLRELKGIENAEKLFISPLASNQSVQTSLEALPLPLRHFDLIVSAFLLQYTNDLPGVLKQIYAALKTDGLFQGILFAGDCLIELTETLQQAEIDLKGGMSAFTAPTITPQDAGMLLQRAGFQLPLVDRERVKLYYPNLISVLKDIKAAGMQAPLYAKGKLSKQLIEAAEAYYRKNFSHKNGLLEVTIDVLFLTGWSYSQNQPKALPRGSGKISLVDALS